MACASKVQSAQSKHGHRCCGAVEHHDMHAAKSSTTSLSKSSAVASCSDVELGLPNSQHVTLQLGGLDCSACEIKLRKVLAQIAGVSNVQISLGLATVEYDWHGECPGMVATRIEDLGYSCERVYSKKHVLNLKTDLRPNAIGGITIDGINIRQTSKKNNVSVEYNPEVFGARDALSKLGTSFTLDPSTTTSELERSSRELRNDATLAAIALLLTIPVLILEWAPLRVPKTHSEAASLVFATGSQLLIGGPFYSRALKSLLYAGMIGVDMLVVLSTTAAFCLSVVSFAFRAGKAPFPIGSFFVASSLLLTLLMIGRLVSTLARVNALKSLRSKSNQPQFAILTDEGGFSHANIDVRLLQAGDIFKVLPDSNIVTDGIVLSGTSDIDESVISGEHLPVYKSPNSKVYAGSRNISGSLVVRLTNLPEENTLSGIARMLEESKMAKSKIQDIADRVTGTFVPVILLLTLVVFLTWIVIGIKSQMKTAGQAVIQATLYGITLLVISCPCAIGLAVPMVVVITGGLAAKHGIIFKTTESMLKARKVTHVVFDKTGTVTESELTVSHEHFEKKSRDHFMPLIFSMCVNNHHPISKSLATHIRHLEMPLAQVEDLKVIPGKGVVCRYLGSDYRLGSPEWLGLQSHLTIRCLAAQNSSICCLANDTGELLALFGLSSQIRKSAYEVVSALQRCGVQVSLVSGDNAPAVFAVAEQLKIPPSHVRACYTPRQKRDYVRTLRAHQNEIIAFIGDGTNDALAITESDVGIHIQPDEEPSISELPQLAADVVMLRKDLYGVLKMGVLSRHAFWRIVLNFVWAFCYNLIAFLVASGSLGWRGVQIPPQYAPLGEAVSVLPVILIAVAMRWTKL
ncbi:MAG: hypothetical protein M1814_005246 [Vezdaea aestivalis]|nr:MAG: hypothetical protein M1814_005246 [Vezdaea aestivalis]